jgi:ferredoxin
MRVWIDPDECMGAGTCEQIAPEVFTADGSGTWCVRQDAAHFGTATVFDGRPGEGHGPLGSAGPARVPTHLVAMVVDAAEQCPGECIYVEV